MTRFDYSGLTAADRARLKSLAPVPDEEVRRRAWAGDPLAWLEFEARWAIVRYAWLKHRSGAEPPEHCPMPAWVVRAWEKRRTRRTRASGYLRSAEAAAAEDIYNAPLGRKE